LITSAQIAAARKLLGWPRDRLAPKAGVSATVLRKIEHGDYIPSNEQLLGIQIALERAGVAFTTGDAPSVKLRAAREQTMSARREFPS
jgi:transcriptional regulator with XRE-family HTH domain